MSANLNAVAAATAVIPSHIRTIIDAVAKHDKAVVTLANKIKHQIESAHGETMPTHAVYAADLKALDLCAQQKGLTSGAHYARLYREAFESVYGALPVVLTGEAARKRNDRMKALGTAVTAVHEKALREAVESGKPDHWAEAIAAHAAGVAAKQVKTPKVRTDATVDAKISAPTRTADESAEQVVTRLGMAAVLSACARILSANKADATKAKTLLALAEQVQSGAAPKAPKVPAQN